MSTVGRGVNTEAGSRRRRLALAVVAVLAAVVLALWLASRPDADPVATPSRSTVAPSDAPLPANPPTPAPIGPSAEPGGGDEGQAPGDPAPAPDRPADAITPGGVVGEPDAAPAVPLDAPADFGTGVQAQVVRLEAVEGEAQGIGEVAGPAVRVTLELVNRTGEPVSLDPTVINMYAGADAVPAIPLSGPGVSPFAGTVAPGERATGVYVFRAPVDLRDRIQVSVSYDATVSTVLFEGPAPKA